MSRVLNSQLTKKQAQLFDYIDRFQQKNNYSPALSDMSNHFKRSVPTVSQHIDYLERKGYLMKQKGVKYSIKLLRTMSDIAAYETKSPEKIIQMEKVEAEIDQKNIADFENKIIQGECLEVMKKIPSKSIDMILCDLPYGTTQNHWDSVIPLDKLWNQYERIIKDNGVIALTGQGIFTAQLILSNQKLFKYKIVWMKSKSTNFLNAKKQPLRRHEDICIFYKNQPLYNPQMTMGEPYDKGFRKNQLTGSYGDFKTFNVKSDGSRYPTDIIYFKTAESEGEVFHPTQKPVELGRYFIKTFTKPGDIILDNTCGSGSFLVSAILEGRKFIGIEKNEEVYLHKKNKMDYIKICTERTKRAQEEYKKVQKNSSENGKKGNENAFTPNILLLS